MHALETALDETFEDFRLSRGEKSAFKALLQDYRCDGEALNLARNHAFALVSLHVRSQPAYEMDALGWLEHIVKTLDQVRGSAASLRADEAWFSPGDACKRRILEAIDDARLSLDVCVFTLSDDDISRALMEARQRQVPVRLITDDDKSLDTGNDVDRLSRLGLSVVKDRTPGHMHHKFAVIDGRTLLNGSFNWTRSATLSNHENLTVSYQPDMIRKFSEEFNRLWKSFGGAD